MNKPEQPQSLHAIPPSPADVRGAHAEHEQAVLKAIRDTAFGTVEITVHQSRIVQITRSEKLRL